MFRPTVARKRPFLLICCLSLVAAVSCRKDDGDPAPSSGGGPSTNATAPVLPSTPYDYASVELPGYIASYMTDHPNVDATPDDNPITNAGATLGRVLFYDKQLSVDNSTACASCHKQALAFTDGLALSEGHSGEATRRNAMMPVNLRYFPAQKMFWDLRAATLEEQALMPITNSVEMGMPSLDALVNKLNTLNYYPPLFQAAFGDPTITSERTARALAQFLRSITSFRSRYDAGVGDNFAGFTAQELQGKHLVSQAFCTECHSDLASVSASLPPTFLPVENYGQNQGFGSNNGLDQQYLDNGIGEITGQPQDQGTFKIPSLRNIELTGPYMHDGRFATLEQVVQHYASGVQSHPNRGIQIPDGGFGFTADQQAAIIAFLKTLTDNQLLTEAKWSDPFPH